jgi:hypothetical protein
MSPPDKNKRRGFTLVFEKKRFLTGVSAWQTGKRFALTNFVLIPVSELHKRSEDSNPKIL